MKTQFTFLALLSLTLLSFTASATSLAPKLTFSCSVHAYQIESSGAMVMDSSEQGTLEVKTSTKKLLKIRSTTLTSQLRQICAADGGPCTNHYELSTSLKIGDAVSSTSSTVSASDDPNFRQHLSLTVGDESAFVNCDKN